MDKEKNKEQREAELKAKIDELRDLYQTMGGEEGLKKRKTLALALLKYKDIDKVLTNFRERVAKYGYKGMLVETDTLPIVEAYGSIKDKAALVIIGYFDMKTREKPVISEKNAEEIRQYVLTCSAKERKEYMTYLNSYDAFRKVRDILYRTRYSYLALAYQSIIYIQTYEWLNRTASLFNSFIPLLSKDEETAKLRELVSEYNSYLSDFQRFGELDEINGEGWEDKQAINCFEYAEWMVKDWVGNRLSQYKGAVTAITKWAKSKDVEMFIPNEVRSQLIAASSPEYQIQELQSKYYRSHLKVMKERGETITDKDKKIAIFPEYDEAKPDREVIYYVTKKLNGTEKA